MSDPANDIDPTLPAIVQEMLRRGERFERILLDASGSWWHQGEPFTNEKIIALFNRSIGRTEGGTWVLRIGRFTYPVEVEATGWFVERVDLDTAPPRVHLSDASVEPLDATSLRYLGGGRLLCRIHGGAHTARFKRNAYYAVAERVVEAGGTLVLRLPSGDVPLGTLSSM